MKRWDILDEPVHRGGGNVRRIQSNTARANGEEIKAAIPESNQSARMLVDYLVAKLEECQKSLDAADQAMEQDQRYTLNETSEPEPTEVATPVNYRDVFPPSKPKPTNKR